MTYGEAMADAALTLERAEAAGTLQPVHRIDREFLRDCERLISEGKLSRDDECPFSKAHNT